MDALYLINKALLKVGLPLAATLDDCDWNARYVLENVAENQLRGFAWGFAQRFVMPERLELEPTFGFNYAYMQPDDCIRVIDCRASRDLRSPKSRFAIQGRKIFTQASPLYLRYVTKDVPIEDWPPDFADAAAARIAVEIAALSAEKSGLVQGLIQIWQLALTQAQLADARENMERVPMESSIFNARSGGGEA